MENNKTLGIGIIQTPKFRPVKFHQLAEGELVGKISKQNLKLNIYQIRFWEEDDNDQKLIILYELPLFGIFTKRKYLTRKQFNREHYVRVGLIQSSEENHATNL